jgi:exopolysaccharide biosynthesis WecB/TagA/CpsF family protein
MLSLDDYGPAEVLSLLAHYGQASFDYLVTPNTDHVIRYHDDAGFRELYAQARYVLLDSRVVAGILRVTHGMRAHVCPGSDLTASVFSMLSPHDRVVLIGASASQAQRVAQRYGLRDLQHYSPPMGFIRDRAAVERTLRFVEQHSPFRFCFLAVGSPQQELLACELRRRGIARGFALCIGASIDFLTGAEQRAPRWMQRLGMEWLYRLLQNPGRMARRYLLRGPRIFVLLPRMQVQLRRATTTAAAGGTASRERIG